ncbi:DUF4262 domain-containing protein [Hymenobacter terricola]|uniref:DUF4262 domain-containing protein n=1 Tax=Hymenobacter terricola TaxID=2819236 RepID=UPI001B3174A8|nr:DUF4262 domain-containing protein [Hymenobacter terricola]
MSHEEHDTQAEINIKNDVKKHGWTVCLFEADTATPAFAYTIGLWKNFNHPELIAFGLPLDTMHAILNDAGDIIKAGTPLETTVDNFEILELHPVQFRQVDADNVPDYFGYAQWFYKYESFPALQLFWTDKVGKFPWEPEFDKRYEFDQPLLDRKLDFKFFEHQNAATFIAEKVLREGRPILWVWHDSDDSTWSFANKSGDKMLIVSLSEAVEHDPTINNLFNLPTDFIATRGFVGDKWKREQL